MTFRQAEYRTKYEQDHTTICRVAACLSLAVWLAMNHAGGLSLATTELEATA